MKKFIVSFFLVFFFSFLQSQKIGVVDTNYILNKLPQYKEAESRLNAQVKEWETEIQNMQADYESKKASFENERVLLIGDQLKQRENEVKELEKNIKKKIQERFGSEGQINAMRGSFAKPFQDQIWNAIKTVAEKNSLGIVLDKSNNISVIYLVKAYDYTDRVLDILLKNSNNSKNRNTESGKSKSENTEQENKSLKKTKR